jgi:uncharacterized membrane protein
MDFKTTLRQISLLIQTGFYFTMGVLHFIYDLEMSKVIPPFFPFPLWLVYISGVIEMILAILLLVPKTRAWACYGLILLLIAVFPANIYMFISDRAEGGLHHWLLLLRLPAQGLLIWWAYWQSLKTKA